jgi:L-histidine Nalpha-methyltransferase
VDRVEMHLVPRVRQTATLRALGLSVEITPAETLWTESSYKFRRESAAAMLTEAGLALRGWYSDRRGMFALALAGTP